METNIRKSPFFFKTSASIAALACVVVVIALACDGKKTKKSPDAAGNHAADSTAVKVIVADVKEGTFEDWRSYSADLRGVEDANLTAPFQGGRVNAVRAIGSKVTAGEALCDIDSNKYEAALEAAKAQTDVTNGELERTMINVENGSLGRSALDAANLNFQNSRMAFANAKRAFEDCRCQAPFDGVLVSRSIEKYQTVSPGVPTLRVSRVDRLEATIAIPETEAFGYEEGMKAEFHLLQRPETIFYGTLASIDRAVDTRSRTVNARIVVSNQRGMLKPGMVGRANILRRTYRNAIVVPATALLHLENGIAAMVVENGTAKQRPLRVEATTVDSALIAEGLRTGDKLVVTGAFQISNGTRVSF
jgi:membrane fusion protein, multidrug efflux system